MKNIVLCTLMLCSTACQDMEHPYDSLINLLSESDIRDYRIDFEIFKNIDDLGDINELNKFLVQQELISPKEGIQLSKLNFISDFDTYISKDNEKLISESNNRNSDKDLSLSYSMPIELSNNKILIISHVKYIYDGVTKGGGMAANTFIKTEGKWVLIKSIDYVSY